MRRILPALLIITTALAGCSESGDAPIDGDFSGVPAPEWATGYAFSYNVSGDIAVDVWETDGGVTEEVESFNATVPSQTYLTYEVLTNDTTADEPTYLVAATWSAIAEDVSMFGAPAAGSQSPLGIRARDLGFVPVRVTLTEECDGGCQLVATAFEFQESDWMDPYLKFPLEEGKKWSSRISVGEDNPLGDAIVVDSTVIGMQAVPVLGEQVDAVRVEHTMRIPLVDAFIAGFKRELQNEGYEDIVIDFDFDGGIISWYAPSIQNVVREESHMHLLMHVGFSDAGERYEIHAELDMDVLSALSGVDLTPAAPMDHADALAYFSGDKELLKSNGKLVAPTGSYTIDLIADKTRVNAADKTLVNFEVDSTDGIPSSHGLRTTITDSLGRPVASGDSPSFSAVLDEPGVYVIIAQALGPNGIQAQDHAYVVADWAKDLDFSCSAISSSQSGTCGMVSLPVRPGVDQLEISLDTSGTILDDGTYYVEDAAGFRTQTDADDDLVITDFGRHTMTSQDWTFRWQPGAAIGSDGTVTIRSTYLTPIPVMEEPEPEPADAGMLGRVLSYF